MSCNLGCHGLSSTFIMALRRRGVIKAWLMEETFQKSRHHLRVAGADESLENVWEGKVCPPIAMTPARRGGRRHGQWYLLWAKTSFGNAVRSLSVARPCLNKTITQI